MGCSSSLVSATKQDTEPNLALVHCGASACAGVGQCCPLSLVRLAVLKLLQEGSVALHGCTYKSSLRGEDGPVLPPLSDDGRRLRAPARPRHAAR